VHWLSGGAPLVAVHAPDGEQADSTESLVDHRVSGSGWFCSESEAPQRYEVAFVDAAPHAIRAVGFVPGVVGPDGVGAVSVRVQTGTGPAARGEEFRATVRGRSEQLQVIRLPVLAHGDHVAVSFLRRSDYVTAACVAELLVYENVEGYAGEGGEVTRAERFDSSGAATAANTPSLDEAQPQQDLVRTHPVAPVAPDAADAGAASDAGPPVI
jgi:hypothetical protein